jgi:hypothetical protein
MGRQLDRIFEEDLPVGDHRGRRRHIGGRRHEGEPDARHAPRGIVDRSLQRANVEGIDVRRHDGLSAPL